MIFDLGNSFSISDVKNEDKENRAYRKYLYHGISHHLGIDVHDLGTRTDGNYYINLSGTPTQVHCLLSATFVGGFYSANSAKAGWTQFAQLYNPTSDSVNITTDTGTVSTSSTATWARSTWKRTFDTGWSYSTETEILFNHQYFSP